MRGVAFAAASLCLAATAAFADPVSLTVTSAVVSREPGGAAGMTLTLSPESSAAFAALTATNIGRAVELRIDGETVLSAVVRDAITGGVVRIAGNFAQLELNAIALRISAGTAKVEADVKAP